MSGLLIALGTRPEVIKLAPVILACRRRGLPLAIVSTGQHREVLAQAFADFGITPDVDLGLMRPGQSLAVLTARAIEALDGIIARLDPQYVVVQGDTTTVASAALAAWYRHVPVGHVEAGLRSGRLDAPFPEELNRRMVSLLAQDHFAPTERAAANLRQAGVPEARLHLVGNTVIDALFQVRDAVADRPLGGLVPELEGLDGPLMLLTCHRRENLGASMAQVARGVAQAARAHPEVTILFPMHPNPAVRSAMAPALEPLSNVILRAPMSYPALVKVLARSRLVVTDSGGLQEEAAALGLPCVVARAVTDRPEAVEAGVAVVVGDDPRQIERALLRLLEDDAHHARMARPITAYGDGRAAERIAAVLAQRVGGAR